MKKIVNVLILICAIAGMSCSLFGCTPNEVTENQIMVDFNQYLSDLNSEIVVTDLEVENRSMNDEGYNETIVCNIQHKAELSKTTLEGSMQCTFVYDYSEGEGWVISSVTIDGGSWTTDIDYNTIRDFILTSDNELMTDTEVNKDCELLQTGNADLSYSSEADDYYEYEFTDNGYDYGIVTRTLKSLKNIQIDRETFNLFVRYSVSENYDVDWKSIDGDYYAKWTDNEGTEKNINITINNGEITNFTGENSKGDSFTEYSADDIREDISLLGLPDLEADIDVKLGDSIWDDQENFQIVFYYDSAIVIDSPNVLSLRMNTELIKK